MNNLLIDLISKYYQLMSSLHRFLVNNSCTCQGAEGPCFQIGYKVRQNTAYVDDRSNWRHLCSECEEVNDAYWTDMWNEYWSGRL